MGFCLIRVLGIEISFRVVCYGFGDCMVREVLVGIDKVVFFLFLIGLSRSRVELGLLGFFRIVG